MVGVKKNPKASIVLLTRNSSKTIGEVLENIYKQNFTDFEVLFIDSSSTDDTIKIAKKYPCRIIDIKPEDFGHGKTRNFAAQNALGEFVVFLTHDSVPDNKNWLEEMLKPFAEKKVAGVYGRQIARESEKILDKHFHSGVYRNKDIVWKNNNWKQGDNLFSDANSAVRKELILKYPYANEIIVSEDYEWAVRILDLGYEIVYSTAAWVTHSHSYNLRTLFKCNFDVGVSYKDIYKNKGSSGFMSNGLKIVKEELRSLRKAGLTHLIPAAIARDGVRLIAIQLGKREQIFPLKFKRNHLSAQKWYWK